MLRMLVWRLVRYGALACAVAFAPLPAQAGDAPVSVADVIAPLMRSVVSIEVKQIMMTNGTGGAPRNSNSFGSGFIIDPSGIIVTNRHVIEHAYEITILFQYRDPLDATVLGVCPCDVALLKVAAGAPLPALKFGDSSRVRIGDPVVAIGNPLGLGRSVSAGIVSALNRDIRTSPFDDYIQTDAAINHGNSGGPLINLKGEVVGINTALLSPTRGSIGIGFAIPSNDASYVVDQLRKNGRVVVGWIGVSVEQMTPTIARAIGIHDTWSTAIVTAVDSKGPAAGKIHEGDVIRLLGDHTFQDIREFMREVAQMPIGRPTTLEVQRDGVTKNVSVMVEEWPEDQKVLESIASTKPPQLASADEPDAGLHLLPITEEARAKYDLDAQLTGVLVSGVDPGSPVGDDLDAGDVILRVQQAAVSTPADVQEQLANARAEKRAYALLLVATPDGRRWIPVALGPTVQ